jgi:hypothetical protein
VADPAHDGRQLHEQVNPRGDDQRSKIQPEAVKDNPLRAPEAQRPASITLRKGHRLRRSVRSYFSSVGQAGVSWDLASDPARASAAMRSQAKSWSGESSRWLRASATARKTIVSGGVGLVRFCARGAVRHVDDAAISTVVPGTRGSVRRTAGRTESRDWWFPAVPGEPLRMRARSPSRSRLTPAGRFDCWIVSALDHREPSPSSATADASRPSSHDRGG